MKLSITTLFICLYSLCLIANDMPVPHATDMPGSEITREEIYIGGELWGLINGGADIFYEYGLERMALQEFTWQDEEFRLELYRMDSPAAAFGIFSVSMHGCDEGGPAGTGDCLNKYQYQLYTGNYYLSLINYSGSTRARKLSLEIGNLIASATSNSRIELPRLLRLDMFSEIIDEVKFIKGLLGLQNVLPNAVPFYEGVDFYNLWFLKFQEAGGEVEIMLTEQGDTGDRHMTDTLITRLVKAGYVTGTANKHILAVKSAAGRKHGEKLIKRILASGN